MRGGRPAFLCGLIAFNVINLILSGFFGLEWGVLAAIAIALLLVGLVLLGANLETLDHVPAEHHRPHIPDEPEPPEEEETALGVVLLSLIIRSEKGQRMGLRAKENDIGIRPVIRIRVNDPDVIGKTARIRFSIRGPRRRTRYDWTSEVPFVLTEGINKIWPRDQEFPIAGYGREIGSWQLEAHLVGQGDYSNLLQEASFVIRRETERPVKVGSDASISREEIEEVAADRGRQTIDDVMEDW